MLAIQTQLNLMLFFLKKKSIGFIIWKYIRNDQVFFYSFALRSSLAMVICFIIALVAFVVTIVIVAAVVAAVALKHIMKTESNDVKTAN